MTKYTVAFLIALFLVSSLIPETMAVLPEINNPTMMDISGSELYILDNVQIKVYSLKDYRFLRKFGKRGEGPGELLTTPDAPFTMIVHEEKVLLNSVYKAIVYDKSGKMVREIKIAPSFLVEAVPSGENYVATKFKWVDATATARTLIVDHGFKELKMIYETALPSSYKKRKIVMPPISTFARCTEDRIFVFDQQKDTIKVFDLEGKPLPDIKVPYEEIRTDDAFKKKVADTLAIHPTFKRTPPEFKKMLYTPDVLPVFRDCRVKGDKLYIQTYRQKGDLSEFIFLDFSGKVLKKLFLPGSETLQIRLNPASTFAFKGDMYYYLVDNLDEEQWELNVQKLD
ncbi:MAG: hypothetical protein KAW12_10875 [Candidatus Aminicenantes bacterium]|nr:hypothetical protein [Candidatus Aminicenantes bacterium]